MLFFLIVKLLKIFCLFCFLTNMHKTVVLGDLLLERNPNPQNGKEVHL